MEHKQIDDVTITVTDEDQGIIEAVWAVIGNVDEGKDIIHPGAFTKTFHERGNQVKLLDNHRTDSVMNALGTVLELKELRGAQLPQETMDAHPDASGGAWGKFQFLIDTPEGKGAFARIKAGAVKGWSFGYDALDKDYSTITNKDGEDVTVRNLRQLKLYEISPVLFPMNTATTTTNVKSEGQPDEGKPYTTVRNDAGKWQVFKIDAEGDPTGDDTENEADAQIRAILAEEEEQEETDKSKNDELEEYEALYFAGKQDKAGRVLSAQNAKRILDAIKLLTDAAQSGGLMNIEEPDKSLTGPSKSDDTPTSDATEAGPDEDKDTRFLQLIDIELEEMEVTNVL